MKSLILTATIIFSIHFTGVAQNPEVTDLCVVTFSDGKTFYAEVNSVNGGIANTRMLHSGSLYSFAGKVVTASNGAYKKGHTCQKIQYYGQSTALGARRPPFVEVIFGDGAYFYAQVTNLSPDGNIYSTKMLHTGSIYKFHINGMVLESNGAYPVGHQTKAITPLILKK
jgi:hypothetical protein